MILVVPVMPLVAAAWAMPALKTTLVAASMVSSTKLLRAVTTIRFAIRMEGTPFRVTGR
jgi:hypothetical protein